VLPLALVGLAGIIAAAVGLTRGPNLTHVAAGLGWPLAYIQAAAKWAKTRGVPLDWVLATIQVESSGNPRAAGDADGRSRGLMQVNVVAHAAELKAAGVAPERLFDPITNIEWGTKYLREFRDAVTAASGTRPLPAPLDVLTRLAYKGPSAVYGALRRGQNPTALSWAGPAIANWQRALLLVRGAEAVGRAKLARRPRVS